MSTTSEQHVDQLTAMMYPAYTKRCTECGGYVVTSPEEAVQRYVEAAYEPLTALARAMGDQSTAAAMTGLPTMGAMPGATMGMGSHKRGHVGYAHKHDRPYEHHRHRGDCGCGEHGHRHHGCHCRECRHDDCHCRCCVVDADLVVHARLGERRVVPITIENDRRREREIRLELSDFTKRGGSDADVTGRLLTPAQFTLGACQEEDAVISIDIGGEAGDKPSPESESAEGGRDRLPDVDDCVVAYADLRIAGCDVRPVRIAVTTLPRDCHSYPVDCSSGCC